MRNRFTGGQLNRIAPLQFDRFLRDSKSHHPCGPQRLRAVVYVLLTAVAGVEVLGNIDTCIASDPGDPLLTAAVLTWNAEHVAVTEGWGSYRSFIRHVLVSENAADLQHMVSRHPRSELIGQGGGLRQYRIEGEN